jgi:hypothetical protein
MNGLNFLGFVALFADFINICAQMAKEDDPGTRIVLV